MAQLPLVPGDSASGMRRRVDQGVAALVAAVITTMGAITTTVVTVVNADPSPTESCIQIYEDYSKEIAKGPKEREAVLPGTDGKSILDSDPQAKYCKFKSEDFP